jgi:Bacteriophage HK97-gp10, putative tail-component
MRLRLDNSFVKDVRELQRALHRLGTTELERALNDAYREAAQMAYASARSRVPRRTGALAGTIAGSTRPSVVDDPGFERFVESAM